MGLVSLVRGRTRARLGRALTLAAIPLMLACPTYLESYQTAVAGTTVLPPEEVLTFHVEVGFDDLSVRRLDDYVLEMEVSMRSMAPDHDVQLVWKLNQDRQGRIHVSGD